MKRALLFGLLPLLLITGCDSGHKSEEPGNRAIPGVTLEQANHLAELPLACMQNAYPNKLGQTLGSQEDMGEPRVLHPAFYGCFDWHSAVHGHWSLVRLLRMFPELEKAAEIREKLMENISADHILAEVDYFKRTDETSYERTYGWAWLLKLAEELHTWDDPLARELENNLQPLTDLMVERFSSFLPKLVYPIRVGEHANTAFGLCFAWDYAATLGDRSLRMLIEKRAIEFYSGDRQCPMGWEPGGFDFLSPCLEEIDLMRRILARTEFKEWIRGLAPQLLHKNFTLEPGRVSDRTDGKLVHLDGLNFSRAWVLYGLAHQYPEYSHLLRIADEHVSYSLPNLVDNSYEGEHWLGTFALYAIYLSEW